MSAVRKLFVVGILCLTAHTVAGGDDPQPMVLHKNEGELRTRRPREGVASPSTEFLLKFGQRPMARSICCSSPRRFVPAPSSQGTNIIMRTKHS